MNKFIKPGVRFGLYSLVAITAGCSQKAAELPVDEAGTAISSEPASQDESLQVSAPGLSKDQQVNNAISDLAKREGVAIDAISIRSARAVIWGSSALGCPDSDMSYTEATVPGIRLLLMVNDRAYLYQGKEGSDLFYCPAERVRAPAYGPGKIIM